VKTTRSEVVGQSLYPFIVRRDRDALYLHLRQLFKYKKPRTCELQLQGPNEKHQWVRLDSYYDQNQPEDIPHSLTAMVDIDEEKQAQAKLAHLAAIVESSADAVIRQDPNGIITHWNPAAEKIYGYSAAEALGQSISLIYPTDCAEETHKLMRRLRRGEKIVAHEITRRTKTGHKMDALVSLSAIYDERGRLAGISSIERDITEQVQARRRLNRISRELRMATSAAGIGTWFVDVRQSTAQWNRQMYLLLGLNPRPGPEDTELFFSFIHPDDRRGFLESFRSLQNKQETEINEEFRIIRHDGHVRWVAARGQLIRNEAGELVQVAGVNYDVTEFKQAQEAERLAQMQLAAKIIQLEQKNQELDQFVYAASHDLKAPLRAISNYSDFLQEDLGESLSGEQKRYLEGLKTAAAQGQVLISDLLEYSRVGRTELRAERIDMPAMLNEVKAFLNLDPEIDLNVQKDWPVFETDRLLLMQVMKNLVGNAVKFNHSASKRVGIGWRQPNENGSIEIFVRDNGIGIEPQYQQQVFGIFQRLHTENEFEGTGIGLAVVKKAAMELGGQVRVDSAPGQGSTFYVEIPAKMTEDRDQMTDDPSSLFELRRGKQKKDDRGQRTELEAKKISR